MEDGDPKSKNHFLRRPVVGGKEQTQDVRSFVFLFLFGWMFGVSKNSICELAGS